jgi:hypothetical protein
MPLARRLALAAAALTPTLVWWLRRLPDQPVAIASPCPLRSATGVPCPTCGGTRALIALAEGHWLDAVAANPLVSAGAAATVLWAVAGVVTTAVPRWRRRLETSPADRRRLLVLALVLTVASRTWLLLS